MARAMARFVVHILSGEPTASPLSRLGGARPPTPHRGEDEQPAGRMIIFGALTSSWLYEAAGGVAGRPGAAGEAARSRRSEGHGLRRLRRLAGAASRWGLAFRGLLRSEV